jgi:uncharacterized tellurite resistance protein B-like protein
MQELKENSMSQAIQIATLICCWDKDFSNEEIRVLLDEIAKLANVDSGWDHSLHRELTCALCDAIDAILQLDNEDLATFIAKAASKMTDQSSQEATLKLAYRAAAADGLDDDEIEGLLHFGSRYWGMTHDEVRIKAMNKSEPVESSIESEPTQNIPNYTPETAICRMAYCIAAVDGQITDSEWETIQEGLSFVNLNSDIFNDAVEDLSSFNIDQLNIELHSLSAFLNDNCDEQTKDTVHEFLMDIATSDSYFEGAKQDWVTIIHDEYWFASD